MSGLTTLNNPGNSLSLPDPGNATITIGGDVTGNSTFTTNQSANETISLSLDNDVVDTAEIADDAVGTAQIADNAITNALMADDAIGINELSASGTASSTTYLRGDNTWASAGGGGNNTSTTAVGAYAMVGATNPTNTNVGTGTSFAGNSNVYQYAGITAGVNNYRFNLQNTGEIARNGNIPAGTWHFRGAGGTNTGRCTLCQRTA